jgi:Nitronate monooxygenase
MWQTRICALFGIEFPIVSAGMGGIAHAELAAAVSEAGGLGTLGLAAFTREGIEREIARAKALTRKPLAANLLIPFLRPGIIETVAESKVDAVTFFWGDAREYREAIGLLHRAGSRVIWQCGSTEEAQWASDSGADAIMAQGFEAGGHVRGQVTTLALIPEVREALPDVPLIAAGGIADARGLVAALALGADGARSVRDLSHQWKRQPIHNTRSESCALTPPIRSIRLCSTWDGQTRPIASYALKWWMSGSGLGDPCPASAPEKVSLSSGCAEAMSRCR